MKRSIKGIFILTLLLSCVTANSQQQTQSSARFRREFLDHINHLRKKGCTCGTTYMPPAPPLTWNDQLEIAAEGHAQDMFNQSYFSHTSKDGRSMEDRIVTAGYVFKGYRSFAIGENIAEGQMSIAQVMQGWIKSEGHCKNLMNPTFKEIAVAEYNHYWVQDFGSREPFSPEQQRLIKSGKYHLIQKGRDGDE